MQVQKQKTIAAIKRLGYKLTAADAAANSGLSLANARLELNRVASDTNGVLEVSKTGDILYCFDRTFESAYEAAEWKQAMQQYFSMVYDIAFYLLRVSFGVLLIASFITIMVVFACALCVIMLGLDASDGDLDMHDGDLDSDFFDCGDLAMFFGWAALTGGSTPTGASAKYNGVEIDTPDRGFFVNCYSFLFGDGDPNKDIDEKHWQCIAEVIRRSNGVITEDQLLPYSLNNKTGSSLAFPTLVRFDGYPEVTPNGNIVYVFPQMQVSAHQRIFFDLPDWLAQQPWKFSNLATARLHWVFFFAGANLCGAYALYNHLSWFKPLLPFAPEIYLLMVYATFFMGFPIVRQLFNTARNAVIDCANGRREQSAKLLSAPDRAARLAEAQQFAQQRLVVSQGDICFSTARDSLEQLFQ